ncbi:hypothetical protein [Micromonospora siamensis]|uniref:Uncharacterized protein n=1 Tax=Micromonospora siamensis TaxID=299152 RepID=A0A1C5JWK7_9ACTN|nr:hypothetical protein [Micromonospora siamensis]SCG74964.1 hypothetical protein GA0074704_5106 [Micromonospora siamensis]
MSLVGVLLILSACAVAWYGVHRSRDEQEQYQPVVGRAAARPLVVIVHLMVAAALLGAGVVVVLG